MLKITMLGLALAAFALAVAVPAANAEGITCTDDRILMVTPSGSPICVYESSAGALLERGFTLGPVQDAPADVSNELPTWYMYESDITQMRSHALSGLEGLSPIYYTINIPSSFTIGETVSIPYSFSWQYENGTSKYAHLGLPEPDAYKAVLPLVVSDEFSVLNDNAITVAGYADRYTPHTASVIYIPVTSLGLTYNGTLNLRLDTPMYYDRDTMMFPWYGDGYHFQVQRTDTGANLVDPALLTDPYDLEQVHAASFVSSANDPEARYYESYPIVNGTFTHIPETRQSDSSLRLQDPPREDLYIPKNGWPDFAEFLRSEIEYRNITDAGGWMIENSLSEKFATDFLTEYPEFVTMSAGLDRTEDNVMSVADVEIIPTGEVACADGHAPMASPSGMNVCVFEESVMKLQLRGFELIGDLPPGAYVTAPIGSGHGAPLPGPPPEVRMSHLPEIGETAVVTVTYTNEHQISVDSTKASTHSLAYSTGVRVSPGFEIVNNGGLTFEPFYLDKPHDPSLPVQMNNGELTFVPFYTEGDSKPKYYEHLAPTALASWESITYTIEVRAVTEGLNSVGGVGYHEVDKNLHVYLDEAETLHWADHIDLYPELYQPPPKMSESERAEAEYARDRAMLAHAIVTRVVEGKAPLGEAVDELSEFAFDTDDIRRILLSAGFSESKVNDALSANDAP